MLESKETYILYQAYEKRGCIRYNADRYAVVVKKQDGTKFHATLNNISFGGFQILCTDPATINLLSQKDHDLKENGNREVEVIINIPVNGSVENIIADCKITYINNDVDNIKKISLAVGLQVIS
ncbi:MAG: hypothetical protein GTO02_17250, partial [Candidatus Dadabacteria bacterium]|nr:hypothetical protein [Candidatus Dadabacteria bacterium]